MYSVAITKILVDLYSRYNVVTTVRSESKGKQVLEAHAASAAPNSKLSYHIVEDVAKAGAFDNVRSLLPRESASGRRR